MTLICHGHFYLWLHTFTQKKYLQFKNSAHLCKGEPDYHINNTLTWDWQTCIIRVEFVRELLVSEKSVHIFAWYKGKIFQLCRPDSFNLYHLDLMPQLQVQAVWYLTLSSLCQGSCTGDIAIWVVLQMCDWCTEKVKCVNDNYNWKQFFTPHYGMYQVTDIPETVSSIRGHHCCSGLNSED